MDVKIKYENNNLVLEKKSKLIPVLSIVIVITLVAYAFMLNYFIKNNGKMTEYIGASIAPLIVIILCWYYYHWSSGSKKIVFELASKTIIYNGKPLAYYKHVKSIFTRSDTENELYKVVLLFTNNKEIIAARTKDIEAANDLQKKNSTHLKSIKI